MADKVIKGTKDKKRFEVLRGSKDTRELRCMDKSCRNIVRQVPDSNGGFKYKCVACGKSYQFMRM